MNKMILFKILVLMMFITGSLYAIVPPVPTSPADGATGVTISGSITWGDVPDAAKYWLRISDVAGPSTPYLFDDTVFTTTWNFSGLHNNTVYYYQLWSLDSSNTWSSTSPTYTFTTRDVPPATPTIIYPTDGATIVPFGGTISWNSVATAVSYNLLVSSYADNNPAAHGGSYTVSTSVSGTSYDYTTHLVNGHTYYYQLQSVDAYGQTSALSSIYGFTVVIAHPVLSTPTLAEANVSIAPTFTWNSIYGALTYNIYIATDAAFTNIVKSQTGLLTNSYNANPFHLNYSTTYYWKVEAAKGAEVTTSDVSNFTTRPLPAPPTIIAPSDGATIVPFGGSISWNSATYAVSYNVLISTFADNNPAAHGGSYTVSTNVSGTSYDYTTHLLNGHTYYYQLQSVDTFGGAGSLSPIYSFTVVIAHPVLTSPTVGEGDISVVPTLTWDPVFSAVSYNVYVSSNAAFTDTLASKTGMLTTSFAIDPYIFTNSTTYYWKVQAVRSVAEVTTSIGHFTTIDSRVPTLWNPGNSTIYYTANPLFEWTYVEHIQGIESWLQVTLDSTFQTGITTVDVGNYLYYQWPTDLPLGKTYYWRVYSATAGGVIRTFSNIQPFTLFGAATPPVICWPVSDATVYTNDVTLAWYIATGSYGLTFDYHYRKVGDAAWSATATTSDIFVTLPGLTPGTHYEYELRSYNGNAYSAWVGGSFYTNGVGTLATPIAAWPLDSTTVYSTSPQLAWYLSVNGTGLTYIVGHGTSQDPSHFTLDTVSTQYTTLSGLTAGQLYFWRVKSLNALGSTTAWSNEGSFTVYGNTANIKPVLNEPVGGQIVYTNKPTLSWTAGAAGVVSYDVYYKKASAGSFTLLEHTTLPYSIFGSALQAGTVYNWFVIAYNESNAASSSDTTTFETVGALGSLVPVLVEPIQDVTVYTTTPILQWYVGGGSVNPVTYEVQVATDAAFDSIVYQAAGITDIFKLTAELTNGVSYYWRARANNGVANTAWSNPVGSFVVWAGEEPVVLRLAPGLVGGAVVSTTSPLLSWYKPTASVPLTYNLQYATKADFSNAVTVNNVSAQAKKVENLNAGSLYFWRVQSKTAGGKTSHYSSVGSFVANKVTSVDKSDTKIPTSFSLSQNYPNPFNPTTTISFGLPKESYVTVRIYDLMGREVKTLVSENKKAGAYEVQWRGDNNFGQSVATGTYLYRISAGDFVQAKKMILMK